MRWLFCVAWRVKGGRTLGTGVRIATASVRTGLAMTLVFHGGAVCGGAHGPRPTRVFARIAGGQGRPPLRKVRRCEQAQTGGVEPRPYGSVTRSATSIGRADVGIGPYGENLGRTKGKSKRIPEYPLAFDRSEELEVFDDVNDFSTDALLSLQGGGADMSGRLENVPVAHF